MALPIQDREFRHYEWEEALVALLHSSLPELMDTQENIHF